MKSTVPKTRILAIVSLFVFFLLGGTLSAQFNGEVPGFDKNAYTHYFDRADREVSPDRWMEEARRGISLARSSWERLASDLIADAEVLAEAGRKLEAWTEEELEARFTEWLQKRFFGSGANALTNKVAGELGLSTIEYVYHVDSEGNILTDDITGDPRIIRPDDGHNFADERLAWWEEAAKIGLKTVNDYSTSLEALFPELLTYISADRREYYESILKEAMGESVQQYAGEIGYLIAREERLLVAKRTSDVLSLRKKSEEEAASAIVSRLITETESTCNEGIASIEARIEAAAAGTGDLAIAGEEWLEAYREQFERGLKAWEDAEERFFLRRIEWEQEVGNTYSAGEAAWSNAYNEVLKERQKWEAKAKALFESGEAVFRQASKNLQEAIAAAKEEFLRDAELRTQAGSDRAKAWVDTYVTTGSVVAGSRENVKFWYGKYKSQDAPALDSDGYTAWIQEEIRGFWSAMAGTFQNRSEYQTLVMQVEAARPDAEKTKGEIEAEYQRLTSQLADIEDRIKKTFVLDERIVLQLQYNATQGLLAQIQPWMNDYGKMHTAAVNKYNAALTALRPEQVLLDEIRAVVDGKRSLEQQEQIISALGDRGLSLGAQYDIALELVKWSDLYYAYQTRALEARDALVNDFGLVMGTGALVDILQDGASSEDFNLDEYQIELIRAQAVAGYWQKRVDIAKAVNQYAEDLTAGRMTDAEGVRAWEEAKAAYDQALVVYAEAQGTLTKAGDDVKAAQIVVAEASQTLAQIDAELDKLNREYAAKMAAYQLNQNTFLLNEMAALYGELLKVNNLLKTDSSSLYITYLEKARGLGVAQMVESGANYLSQLITGVGTGNGISLVDLTREYEGIPEVTTIDDLSGNIEGFNLTESNLYYGVITGLLDEQAEKLNGITAEEKITAIKNQYGALIIEAVKSAKAYAGQLVQDRVIAMGLLAADDVTSWYYAYSGRTNEGVDKEALVQQGIYERLNEELTEAQWDSFASQIALEAAALEYYLDNTADVSEEAKKLSVFFSLEETAGPAVLSELQNLLALLDSRNSLDVVDLQRKLETFNGVSGLVSLFMQGGGLFTVQGRSLASIFLTSDTIKVENLSSMMQVYEEINFGSSAVEWENITAAFAALQQLFKSYGLAMEAGKLPRHQVLVDAIKAKNGNLEQGVARFLLSVDQSIGAVPDWLGRELDEWQSSVLEYAATCAGYQNQGVPVASSVLKESVKTKEETLQQVLKVLDRLESGGVGIEAGAICALLALPGDLGGLDRGLLEEEAVLRIGKTLAQIHKALDMSDSESVRTALNVEADRNHGYASADIRERAVQRAFELLSITHNLQVGADLATLTGYGREIVLQDLLFSYGLVDESITGTFRSVIESYCSSDALLESRSAYFLIQELANTFGEDAERADVLSVWLGADDEDSLSPWLENIYAVHGTAFGDEVASMTAYLLQLPEFSVAACEEMLKDWFSTGLGNITGLFSSFTDNPIKEMAYQLARYDLAESLESLDMLEAILDELGLVLSGSIQGLYDQVREPEFDPVLETLAMNTGALGAEGILYRLKWNLLNNQYDAYEAERSWYESYVSAHFSTGSLEAKAAEAVLEEANELYTFLELAKQYTGALISGDALQWALNKYDNDYQKALNLAEYLNGGAIRDPLMDMLSWDSVFPGGNVVVEQIVSNAAMELMNGLSDEITLVYFEEIYSSIYETAAKAREASKANEHWRIYVSAGELLQEYNNKLKDEDKLVFADKTISRDEADYVKGAGSWLEGALIDLVEEQDPKRQKLEDVYARYITESTWQRQEDFRNIVQEYIGDTSKEWEDEDIFTIEYELRDAYARAVNDFLSAYETKKYYSREVGINGNAYKLSANEDDLKKELDSLSLRIHTANEAYQSAAEYYGTVADRFSEIGNTYDSVYAATKRQYDELENKRSAYEVQDAIRRWASTAYLNQGDSATSEESLLSSYKEPLEELAYSQARFDRAAIALDALKGLYDNGETDRLYDDNEYNEKYLDYQKSFSRMILTAKANASTASALVNEYDANQKYHDNYKDVFRDNFTDNEDFIRNYTSNYRNYNIDTSNGYTGLSWMDVITIDANGKLKLAYNGSYKLQFVTPEQAEALVEYFTPSEIIGSDLDESSAYEQAVREWGQRMAQYNFNQNNRLQTWGLARDYLMRMLGDNNELSIAAGYAQANTLSNGKRNATALFGWFGSTTTVGEILDSFRKQTMIEFSFASLLSITDGLYGMQENAWKSMSATEKADLEFYIILTLIGGEDLMGLDAVTQVSAYEEYKYFEKRFLPEYRYYEKRNKWWRPNAKRKFKQLRDLRDAYKGEWGALQNTVASGGTEINKGIASFNSTYQAYVDSCEKINTIKGKKTGDEYVIWEDVEKALMAAGTLTADEITELSVYWTDYIEAGERKHKDVSEALAGLANWSESARKDARDSVESQWKFDEQERKAKEQVYRDVYEAYIDGIATKEQLEAAAAEVYGEEAAARKTHQKNMAAVLISDLDGIIEDGGEHMTEYLTLANEYALLIRQAYGTRFEAELAAREAEWEQQTRDINEKYKAWVEASGLILERGREDWLSGIESFNQKHAEWRKRFEAEYTQVSNAWAAAYLEGLEEKSAWVEQATEAADNALTGTMLAMVGIDAEAGARKFDTLDPVGMPGLGGVEEASTALDGLLNMAGITGMETAFTAMAGSAGTIATQVQRGLGGISGMNTWNSGQIQVAATAFARESNALLAAGEAKKLAYMAREIAEEAIEGLYTSVKEANENFSESMDENFAAWEKNGNTYTKRFIAYSTLLSDKYERVSVAGYREYIMSPFNFETDLSEERLINLSSLAIQVLISDAQEEVKEKSEEIFGTADENTKKAQSDRTETINVYKKKKVVTGFREVVHTIRDGEYTTRVPIYEWQDELKDTQYRSEGAGEYGRHIGYAPVTVAEPDVDKGKNSLFVNSGKGELGRLMSEYIYYQMKEDLGWAYSQRAPWEKPLWDDRDTTINAPSLRSVVDIGMQIVTTVVGAVATPFTGGASLVAAIAVNTAMNVADDAVFGALDVAGGFKTFGEAGFEFGKKVLSSAATSTISAGFGGFGSFLKTPTKGLMGAATNGLTGMSKVLTQTVVSGMQTMTTTLVNSTINSFTYSEEDKFGFSGDIFAKSMQGGLISMAGGMTSTFTSGVMNWGLNGFVGDLYNDGSKLSGLVGGLAGQGVEYAVGGNFTLNALNLSMFSGLGLKDRGGNAINVGLLELKFGRDGFDMGLGTGGVDASFGTIASAVRGLEAWKVNAQILTSGKDAAKQYASSMRTLYSVNDVTRAEYDAILAGKTLVEERAGADFTESVTKDGIKTIYLGQNALNDGSAFGLNVYFAHEAYRDGKEGDSLSQSIERDNAVQGHVEATQELIKTYGVGAISSGLLIEAVLYASQTGNDSFVSMVKNAYDATGDFWKLTKDGQFIKDKDGWFRDETGLYINKDGTRSETIQPNTLGDADFAKGLQSILGIENIHEAEALVRYYDEGYKAYEDLFMEYGESMGDIAYQAFQINKGYQLLNGTTENDRWADTPYNGSRFTVLGTDEKGVPIIATRVGEKNASHVIVVASPHGDERSAKWLIIDSQRQAGIAEDLDPGSTFGAIYYIPSISPTLQFADARGIPNEMYDTEGNLTVSIQDLFDNQTSKNRSAIQEQPDPEKYTVGADANRDASLRLKSTQEFIKFMESLNTENTTIAAIMMHGYGKVFKNVIRDEAGFYFQGDFSQTPFKVGPDNTAIGNALKALMGYSNPNQNDNYVYWGTPASGEYLQLLATRGIWAMDIELPQIYNEGYRKTEGWHDNKWPYYGEAKYQDVKNFTQRFNNGLYNFWSTWY